MDKRQDYRYCNAFDNRTETSGLMYVFYRYADETISDEQVWRVMEPVRRRIMETYTENQPT